MGGLSVPDHAMTLDSERAEHDSERQSERLEHGALLDVELEIRGRGLELGAGVEGRVEVDVVLGQGIRKRDPVAVDEPAELVLVGHRPCGRARAEEAAAEARALLVGPVDQS